MASVLKFYTIICNKLFIFNDMRKHSNLILLKIMMLGLLFLFQAGYAAVSKTEVKPVETKAEVNKLEKKAKVKNANLDQQFEEDKQLALTVMRDIKLTIFEHSDINSHDLNLYKQQITFLQQLFYGYYKTYTDNILAAHEMIRNWESTQNQGSLEVIRIGVKLYAQSRAIIHDNEIKINELEVILSELKTLLVDIFNRRVSVSDSLLFSNVSSFYSSNSWQVAAEGVSTHLQEIIYDIKHVKLKDEGLPSVGTWFVILLLYLVVLRWILKYSKFLVRMLRRVEKRINLRPIYQVVNIFLKGIIPALFIYFAVDDLTNPSADKYDNIIVGLIFSLVCSLNFALLFYVSSMTLFKRSSFAKNIWLLILSFMTFIILLNNNINPFLYSTQFYPFIGIYGVAAINLIIVLIISIMGLVSVYLQKDFLVKKVKNKVVASYLIWSIYVALISAPIIISFGYSNLVIGFIVNIMQTGFCLYFVYLSYKIFTTFLFLAVIKSHEYFLEKEKDKEKRKERRVRRSYAIRWLRFLFIILTAIATLVLIALFWGVPPLSIENLFDMLLFSPFPISDNENFSLSSILYGMLVFIICYVMTLVLTYIVENQILRHTLATSGTKYAIKMSMKYLGIIISIVVFVYALGVDTSSMTFVISGLSIGVGFALKDTLSNFFLGILALVTRYVRAGDWVYTTDESIQGTIEHIGLHSTIVRAFDQRPIIVPNSLLMSQALVNASRMTNRRILQYLGVRYDDLAVVKKILKDVKRMLLSHSGIDQTQTTLVNLVDGSTDMGSTTEGCYGDYSINFMVYTFTKTTNWVEFQNIQDEIMLKIGEIIESNGAEIAFPTSTLYLNKGQHNQGKP